MFTKLKDYREEAGLNQSEFAERVGITRQTVINWETGKKYPRLRPSQYRTIAEILTLSIAETVLTLEEIEELAD